MKRASLPSIPAPLDEKFNAAKRMYAEQFGDALVTNTYLKLALLSMSLVVLATLAINWRLNNKIENFKPWIIRIDTVGRAEGIRYDDTTYKPQDKELKYFLSTFCRLYYSRNRATLRDNFKQALLFMETQLADSTLKAWVNNHTIEDFLTSQQPDQEINVQRIDIEDLRALPLKATVTYQVTYFAQLDRAEIKRTEYTAHFIFGFRDEVPNNLVQINPLGFAITYFREDEAFH